MALTCPVCKASNLVPPHCRRCKADLTDLFALAAEHAAIRAQAREQFKAGQWQQAYLAARRALAIRQDPSTLRLAGITALLAGDLVGTWHCYCQESQTGTEPMAPG